MLVSANWLQELLEEQVTHQDIISALTSLGLEVESAERQGDVFKHFYVGHVKECVPHENADKLRVCTVDIGEDATRTIVCGAPNVDAGQKVAVAIEGAIVPSAGFEIGKRKIRGVESRGMICSRSELGVGEEHDGIWVLEDDAPVGTDLAEFLEMNDTVIDIAITPNRADCTSHFGVARDLAAYFDCMFKDAVVHIPQPGECSIGIEINNQELCTRYAGVVVENVKVVESPDWLKQRLQAVGLRPRNVIVDITNFVLMECGHPLHAFDADEIKGRSIVVETAGKAQKFTTLDGKERELTSDMLMIKDAEGPVAIAGVMGGQNSEISDKTTTVFLESAWFQPSSVRKTARALGIHSDASYRFERGADVNRIPYALWRAATLIEECADGKVQGEWLDVYPQEISPSSISLRFERTRELTGATISDQDQLRFLDAIGCKVIEEQKDGVVVSVPTWRVDLKEEADLIEECLRLYGYDNVELPTYAKIPHTKTPLPKELKPCVDIETLRSWLCGRGFAEMYNQCIINPQDARLFGEGIVELANPLGEEMSVMRPSLLPSVAKVIGNNNRRGTKDLCLFEIGTVFRASSHATSSIGQAQGFVENKHVVCAMSGNVEGEFWGTEHPRATDFYDVKGLAEHIAQVLRIPNMSWKKPTKPRAGFGANVLDFVVAKKVVGHIGALNRDLLATYDASETYVFELNITALESIHRLPRKFKPTLQFPSSDRDLAFVLDEETAAGEVSATIEKAAGKYLLSLNVFDVFRHDSLGAGKKSLAFQLVFNGKDRTLKDKEVDQWIAKVVKSVKSSHGGELR